MTETRHLKFKPDEHPVAWRATPTHPGSPLFHVQGLMTVSLISDEYISDSFVWINLIENVTLDKARMYIDFFTAEPPEPREAH